MARASIREPGREDDLSLRQARRIALAAQGFARARPQGRPDARHLLRVAERLGLFQIDSVNVLSRAHYLPAFARLGPYSRECLDDLARGRRRRLFEYWGHEASLMPLALQPSLRWRMARADRGEGIYRGLRAFATERRAEAMRVLAEIDARGPLAASDLEQGGRGSGSWWGWSEGKRALEWLFWAGHVTTHSRRNFERLYDLSARVLPTTVLETPTPSDDDAQRNLLAIALRALGIATETDLRDYFRTGVAETRARLAEMVEDGAALPVTVEGWRQPAFLDPTARIPRRVDAHALLSPFDSLIFERARTERLFGFRYRIEIYTPAERRVHGYYVLPFLMGERLVARVDLKADRAAGALRVLAAHAEPDTGHGATAEALRAELDALAVFLGLSEVRIGPKGDLAPALAATAPPR